MIYTTYILYSAKLDRYYIGHTHDLDDRLYRHNNSGSKATKKANDWEVVYTQAFDTKSDACRRELYIKNRKSRKYIEQLVKPEG